MKRLRRRLAWLLVRLAEKVDPDWIRVRRPSGSHLDSYELVGWSVQSLTRPKKKWTDWTYDPSMPLQFGSQSFLSNGRRSWPPTTGPSPKRSA